MSPFIFVERRDMAGLSAALKLIDINTQGPTGMSLLHSAAAKDGSLEMTEELIRRGINVNLRDSDGATALLYAAEWSRIDVAEAILNAGGDLNIEDEHGNQPLWYAAGKPRPNYELIELFMRRGADPHHRNRYGTSPLDLAKQRKNHLLMRALRGVVDSN